MDDNNIISEHGTAFLDFQHHPPLFSLLRDFPWIPLFVCLFLASVFLFFPIISMVAFGHTSTGPSPFFFLFFSLFVLFPFFVLHLWEDCMCCIF